MVKICGAVCESRSFFQCSEEGGRYFWRNTAGPAINPMIKVVNILAILIIPIFIKMWIARGH